LQPDIPVVFLVFAGLFGLLIGSFLNVCIYRIPRDVSVVVPRSFCPECGAQIAWFDNIPLLSYTMLRGRCRACAKPIGFRYPTVELATAVLFVWTVAGYGLTLSTAKWLLFEAILVVLFFTDLEERILPDEFTIGGSIAGLIFAFFLPVPGSMADLLVPGASPLVSSLFDAVVGASLLAVPIAVLGFLWSKVRRREALGLGDVKLLILLGIFLGLEKGIVAVLVGSVGGAVIGLLYIVFTRKRASTYELPLGSFMCVGAVAIPLISKL